MKKLRQALLISISCLNLSIGFSPTQVEARVATEQIPTTEAVCPRQLAGEIQAIATRPQFQRSRWGILVQTLDTGATLVDQDSRQYFIPASNVKLLTTAAALAHLGAQFRIRTSVYGVPSLSGTATGLRVLGRGDPGLTDAQLQDLAQQLHRQGITQVDRLTGDDSYFQGDAVNLGWEWEDLQAGYGAPVNSLMLNQNAIAYTLMPQALGQPLRLVWDNAQALPWRIDNRSVTVAATEPGFVRVERDLGQPIIWVRGQLPVGAEPETGAIAIPNPAQHFIQRFQQILVSQGITVTQTDITSNPTVNPQPEVAHVLSVSLAALLIEVNQDSNNLYAESLLRQLGATQPSQPNASVLEQGIAVAKTTLTRLGIDPQGYDLADGSGLSRHNLASPEALVQTLRAMARSPHASLFRNSLAVAGVNGTLRNRFRDTPVQGRLQGKTGAMGGVAALSGYITPPTYPPLAFSIILNHFDQPVRDVRPAIDEMILLLGRLRVC